MHTHVLAARTQKAIETLTATTKALGEYFETEFDPTKLTPRRYPDNRVNQLFLLEAMSEFQMGLLLKMGMTPEELRTYGAHIEDADAQAPNILPDEAENTSVVPSGEPQSEPTAETGSQATSEPENAPEATQTGPDLSALSVETLHGVGPKLAEVLEEYGYKNLADIEKADPAHLTEVPGVGEAKAADWAEQIKAIKAGGE